MEAVGGDIDGDDGDDIDGSFLGAGQGGEYVEPSF